MFWKWITVFVLLAVQSLRIFAVGRSAPLGEIPINIYVNDKEIYTDVDAFLEDGTTYVPIRAVSEALCVQSVTWDDAAKTAVVQGDAEVRLTVGSSIGYVDGHAHALNGTARLLQDRLFVPLRFVAEALGAEVVWDQTYYIVEIEKPGVEVPAASVTYSYTREEIFWLARIIEAESAGEPMQGRIAVGNVVLNRVASPLYPNTIYGVIFDRNYGVQFQPVANGMIYNTPGAGSVIAAKRALGGENYAGNSLYFLNESIATSFWITQNREYYTTIHNHTFYL